MAFIAGKVAIGITAIPLVQTGSLFFIFILTLFWSDSGGQGQMFIR
jgi:hypothetical protein